MPEFMLTGPDGKSYKLTTPDGVTHEDAERELARTMTHQPEQPNPAEPYLKGIRDFAAGGVSDVLRGAGVQMPQASNAVGDLLKSDAANTAIGMVNPIKGAGRLPQPPLRQRLDRPINQQTLDEMRAAPQMTPPPGDPRPINPATLSEMRMNERPFTQPVNVYHGTNADVEAGALDPAFAKNKYEQATFFTDDPSDAKNYGSHVIGATLDPRRGLTVDKDMFDFFAKRGDPVQGAVRYAKNQYQDYVVFDLPGQKKTYAVFKKDALQNPTGSAPQSDPLGTGPLSPLDPLSK